MSSNAFRRTTATAGLAGIAAAALLVAGAGGSAASPAQDDAGVTAVRNATEKFQDVSVAEAAGYIPVSHCEARPGAGGMGIHYLHPGLASDGKLAPGEPEVLLYEPTDSGLVLVAVEYFVAEAAAHGKRPTVLGRPLNGPMAGHNDQMPSHYDLHLWVWKDNPNGMSADWNPAVSCDAS